MYPAGELTTRLNSFADGARPAGDGRRRPLDRGRAARRLSAGQPRRHAAGAAAGPASARSPPPRLACDRRCNFFFPVWLMR